MVFSPVGWKSSGRLCRHLRPRTGCTCRFPRTSQGTSESSARMEAMATAVAVAIIPPTAPLDIHTDSRSAIYMMHQIMAPIAFRVVYNSPDAFLWLHLREWLNRWSAPIMMHWVQGHSGDAGGGGDEEADRLAASARGDPSVTTWTTQIPPPREALFWIVYDGRVVPKRPRRLLREQDEVIITEQLVKQINTGHDLSDRDTGGCDAHLEAATTCHPSRWEDTVEELLEYHQWSWHQVLRILVQAALRIPGIIGAATSVVPSGVQSPRAIPVRKV
jgi:ribonuclease HI